MGARGVHRRPIPAAWGTVLFFLSALALAALAGGGEEKKVEVDPKAGTIALPAVVAKQGIYDVLKGAIEYALVSKGGKEYETLFTTEVTPQEIAEAFATAGLKPGRPAREASLPEGFPVRVLVEYQDGEKKRRRAIDEFVLYTKTEKPLEAGTWTFTGSVKAVDPATKAETLQCSLTRSIIGLHFSDPTPLLQNSRPEARTENIYHANLKELPPTGKPVRIIFEREERKLAADLKRVHAFASGRVQGVGYREFAQREARALAVVGSAENLPDGRVEIIVEGPKDKVKELLLKLARGPRAAQVADLEQKDEPPEGLMKDFVIR
jgi:acylphosphatase